MTCYAARLRRTSCITLIGFFAIALIPSLFVHSARASSISWSAPSVIDSVRPFSRQPPINDVACPSVRFCLGIQDEGVVASSNPRGGPGTWQPIGLIDVPGFSGAALSLVDCRSARRCIVANSSGDMLVSARPTAGVGAWHALRIPSGITSISCPSPGLCVGVTSQAVLSSTHPAAGPKSWRRVFLDRTSDSSTGGVQAVSCPSRRLCVVVGEKVVGPDGTYDYGAYLATSTQPTGGRGAWNVTRPDFFSSGSLQCPSVRWCVVTGSVGVQKQRDAILTSTRPTRGLRAWRSSLVPSPDGPRVVPSLDGPLACPTRSFCAEITSDRILSSTNPTGGLRAWRTRPLPGPLDPTYDTASGLVCGSTSLCVASYFNDSIRVSTSPGGPGRSWKLTNLGQGSNRLTGVSCPASDFCAAVDDRGRVLVSGSPTTAPWPERPLLRGTSYAAPTGLISCPTSSFCAAGTSAGFLTSSDPISGPWSLRALPKYGSPSALSCRPSQLCVFGEVEGDAVVSPPPGSAPAYTVQLGHTPQCDKYSCYYDTINQVSCAGEEFCAATDGANLWVTTDPTNRAGWHRTPLPSGASALTCTAAPMCVIAGAGHVAITTDPTDPMPTWHTTALPTPSVRLSDGRHQTESTRISCASTHLCVVIDNVGGYAFSGDPAAGTWTAQKIDASEVAFSEIGIPETPALQDISCPSNSQLCLAVDATGHSLTGRTTG